MAAPRTSIVDLLCFSFFILFLSSSSSAASFRPKALVAPVTKDASTHQYLTRISQRSPLVPVDLVLHLGGEFLWVDCHANYVSTTYRPVLCRSAPCSLAGSNGCGDCFSAPRPGCNNNTCGVSPDNPVTHTSTGGELAQDVVSVSSTDGSSLGKPAAASGFVFSCAPSFLLQGLAKGAVGIAGLGRTRVALPSQFSSVFSFNRKFAICLTSSTGVVFFGDGPYNFLPNVHASELLTYTPLLINPVSTAGASSPGQPSAEYFIGVKSIRVGEKDVKLNNSLLTIDAQGNGGTKISTVDPYTVMETSIFKAVTEAFVKEAAARNITRSAAAVAPFEVCFGAENVLSTRVGASVPWITLDLEGQGATWTITGSNSMVDLRDSGKNLLCLAVVDGGRNPRSSIVIGGYQMEDNLMEFDLARSRLGFSSTLLGRRTTCANFNFTSAV
ncbi:unnamed protein product [Cuscuta campestris]|uniref:Peptidase A1 domain-containing protein n=1 Tax=Cuscuta campestris TaxID=132261 RepID=A0A484K1G9_9ASTE|nr:unnamed protein product [Cuscuta campestris]